MPVIAALTVVEKSEPAKLAPGEMLANYARCVGFCFREGRCSALCCICCANTEGFDLWQSNSLSAFKLAAYLLLDCCSSKDSRNRWGCAVGPQKVVLNDNAPAEGP